MNEVAMKIASVRSALVEHDLAAIRFRGVDWFSWITAGGSSSVLLSSETGVADVLITSDKAYVLTDLIERDRLCAEEITPLFEVWAGPWQKPEKREVLVEEITEGKKVASDRPQESELPLPMEVLQAKRVLLEDEQTRYRHLGQDAAMAMREVLSRAAPDWSERRLAGEGARALWSRGIEPALILAAGEERVEKYRHPLPSHEKLGRKAMLVFCGRRYGLYANLTRFVLFDAPNSRDEILSATVMEIEAAALNASKPGARLSRVYQELKKCYEAKGWGDEINRHHQGGTTGYLAREIIASAQTKQMLAVGTPVAWNPSLPGAKIEDTYLCEEKGLALITEDPLWPSVKILGRSRPLWLHR
jgi:Xaa-Pro aminopeptidase